MERVDSLHHLATANHEAVAWNCRRGHSRAAVVNAVTYLKGLSPGLRSFVMFSKERPFLATNSANLSTTFCTSGSAGGGSGAAAAAEPASEAAAAHCHGQRAIRRSALTLSHSKSSLAAQSARTQHQQQQGGSRLGNLCAASWRQSPRRRCRCPVRRLSAALALRRPGQRQAWTSWLTAC